jgi:archaellum component FlaC
MEYFFKRLEAYIKVRPTAAMRDIIVKIMVEVISILGVVTKEIRQGRTSMPFAVDISLNADIPAEKYLKNLFGMKDVEDALQRLDNLTQEEARMAAAETLTITRGIDDKVNVVDERLEGVDERVQSVDVKVEGIDGKVQGVDDKVQGVDDKVQGVDSKVQDVDHKVGSVIEGDLYRISCPNLSSTLYPVRCKRNRSGDSTSGQSSQQPKSFVIVLPHHCQSRKLDLSFRE